MKKSSEKLLHRVRMELIIGCGILILIPILEKFGITGAPEVSLFWGIAGAVVIIGFWLTDCTEAILAAIKEQHPLTKAG